MRHFLLITALFCVLVSASVARAETVILDDAVNHEDLALKADRMLKDACEHLMDCRYGTQQLQPESMYTSAKGQRDYATMTSSTLDTSRMKALFATEATQATNADSATRAVWTPEANTAAVGVPAFTSDNINDITMVSGVVHADEAYKLGYASSANNANMPGIYAMYVEGAYGGFANGYINYSRQDMLYATRPEKKDALGNYIFKAPNEAKYVRNSSHFNNQGELKNWSEGQSAPLAGSDGKCCGVSGYTAGQQCPGAGCGALATDTRPY